MPFVLDASVAMSWCFVDERTAYGLSVLLSLQTTYAVVPALWSLEVVNVLAVSERRGRISAPAADEFLNRLAALDIRVAAELPATSRPELLLLARLYSLTAYDAAYLLLAKKAGLPLATLDEDLITAARSEGVPMAAA